MNREQNRCKIREYIIKYNTIVETKRQYEKVAT